MDWNHEDTIVALATPPGVGAIGVIRLSGKSALNICNGIFPMKDLNIQLPNTLHVGQIFDNENVIDEVVVGLFRAPRSYTGEDVVEISCHGSPFVTEQIIQLCIRGGARLARPGEFTLRAFLNGKMDLAQAEAVADLIASNTRASHHTAMQQIRGGFSHELMELREELIRFSALIELELDFSQEDISFADRGSLRDIIRKVGIKIKELIGSFRLGNVIKNGVNAVISGLPNAGKSTLLNSLLNEDRAIVSEIPGTTRDTIEEVINIGGILFRLIDTAGLRDQSGDQLEELGMIKAREKIKSAELVIYVFDVTTFSPEEYRSQVEQFSHDDINFIMVGNKIDLAREETNREKYSGIHSLIFVSAKSVYNLSELKKEMINNIFKGDLQFEHTVISSTRHLTSLEEVFKILQELVEDIDKNISGDLLAVDIRRVLMHIGEITGEITNEEQLDFIFSKFCIGK
ncbi:MAG TPA: tRNA uridine-5-carboxymethylaminomethyl(34) synthesis GTPase MnmE [Chitinophagaceae bacterium]|nr:tRNA uridine-5-carboxymethylaminomethyl(34) synthesis GTPase MnmE [Chitinophagaceae bacterium]